MPAMKRFEEWDRVEFTTATGLTVHATVIAAEENAVRLVTDGGKYRLRVPPHRLNFSGRAVRRDLPSPMDAWQIMDFVDGEGGDSTKFSCTISRHGVAVARASNEGYGAPDLYLPFESYAVVEELAVDVGDWISANGGEPSEFVDPVNFWILWRARKAPFGVLASEAIEDYLSHPALSASTKAADEPEPAASPPAM